MARDFYVLRARKGDELLNIKIDGTPDARYEAYTLINEGYTIIDVVDLKESYRQDGENLHCDVVHGLTPSRTRGDVNPWVLVGPDTEALSALNEHLGMETVCAFEWNNLHKNTKDHWREIVADNKGLLYCGSCGYYGPKPANGVHMRVKDGKTCHRSSYIHTTTPHKEPTP